MKKKIFVALVCVLLLVSSVFAEENWFDGLKLKNYEIKGLHNVDATDFYDVINPYLEDEFTRELYSKIETQLYRINGVKYISANVVDNVTPSGVKLVITVTELPMIKDIKYIGNDKVKSYDITDALDTIKVANFIDPTKKTQLDKAVKEVKNAYLKKGFVSDTPVTVDYSIDEKKNTIVLTFTVEEGEQTRILSFNYSGNDNIPASNFKKIVSSKTKSLFNNGFLDMQKIQEDAANIEAYYATLGYIDAKVSNIKIDDLPEQSSSKYKAVNVTFEISEGSCWYYGGINVTGNTIYSDEEIYSKLTLKQGSVLNLESLQNEITTVTDLYYDNGYISNYVDINEDRDESTHSIVYNIAITEGPQAYVEDVIISGLTKTKEYVMTRELELKPGDVFSKAKLVSSAQNLYNTGLLSDLNYDLQYGSKQDNVIVEYDVVEGNQMDIQFGATFGGTVTGFPISGFLQWSDHNFLGRGQDVSIDTTLSPDTQSIALSFSDDWVKSHRWANGISLSFTHTKYEDQMQKAPGVDFYDGRNAASVYPKGADENWDGSLPASKYLMDYDLLTTSLSYQSGYTFMFNSGRLSLSGGLSIGINKALYNQAYTPFEKITNEYGQKGLHFSNMLVASITWDGRDYIYAPTRGYVLSASASYAGGLLGGLSNYIRVNASADTYFKVLSIGSEEKKHNLMLCFSTDASIMLDQFYKIKGESKWAWHDPRLGATEYEMLYIDGMTMARGHGIETDNVFLWDNMIELSYPIAENVLQAEIFASATALAPDYSQFKNGLNWYFAAGAGVRLKISGFPLGFYIVKDAKLVNNKFSWIDGEIGHGKAGLSFVLAISTSII